MTGASKTSEAVAAMLRPRAIAVVGASERQVNVRRATAQNEGAGISVYLVNPRHREVYGRPAYPTLDDLPGPVDAVLSMVNAELTIDVVEAAARVGARGVVITAAGFGETDDAGRKRQQRITEIAGPSAMAICGPNCNGLLNVAAGVNMFAGRADGVRPGTVALLSQSGGLATAALSAGAERMLGFSHVIATGNEAVTDLVDYLEVLISDDAVSVIVMVIEEVRRPPEFVHVAYRARAAGKPLIALKLGRSDSGKRIGVSHTGAFMGDARHYDAAFRQLGVHVARDIDDLLDLPQMFASLPRERWRRGQRIGALSASGGNASLVSDAFAAAGLALQVDDDLTDWVHELVPTNALGNPFDVTGVLYNEAAFEPVLGRYAASNAYDSILVLSSGLGPDDEQFNAPVSKPLQRLAAVSEKRLMIASATASRLGAWTSVLLDAGVGMSRGIVPAARSIQAMDAFLRTSERQPPEPVAELPRPAWLRTAADGQTELVRYADAARLAAAYGIPVVPFAEISADDAAAIAPADMPAAESYVVKAADSLHRTEHGLVHRHVPAAAVAATVAQLARRTAVLGLSGDVIVQPDLGGGSEVFLGADTGSAFGPVVAFGIGGVFVEALADVAARIAPFTSDDARDLVSEIHGRSILNGHRGSFPWDIDELCAILVGFGNLAVATAPWLASVEINPLIRHAAGVSAVDLSLVIRHHAATGPA